MGERNADPVSREPRVGIGRILDPRLSARDEVAAQALRRHPQQRPDNANRAGFDDRSHCRETIAAAAPAGPQHDGFALVALMMADKQMKQTALQAPLGEKPVARRARPCRDAACRLVATPTQDFVFDAECFQPTRDPAGFRRGRLAQAMVDAQRDNATAPMFGPMRGQQT